MKIIASFFASLLFSASLIAAEGVSDTGAFSGKVAETMSAGPYTYALIDTGTNKVWVAARRFAVATNDVVSVADSMPMADFHSKSLNRTFSVIYFASSLSVNGKSSGDAQLPAGHPPINGAAGLPPGHPPTDKPGKVEVTPIQPAKGGKTVAEVYASSAKLAGKTITIRGKVVKYNADIMGRNWLHIQDGTGAPGSNDLLVTSKDTAKLGATVLVEGKVATNRDFGASYKYAVLIEDAKLTIE